MSDASESGDLMLRNPIAGVARCCARVASGHAAAPPSIMTNIRRLMDRQPSGRTSDPSTTLTESCPGRRINIDTCLRLKAAVTTPDPIGITLSAALPVQDQVPVSASYALTDRLLRRQ